MITRLFNNGFSSLQTCTVNTFRWNARFCRTVLPSRNAGDKLLPGSAQFAITFMENCRQRFQLLLFDGKKADPRFTHDAALSRNNWDLMPSSGTRHGGQPSGIDLILAELLDHKTSQVAAHKRTCKDKTLSSRRPEAVAIERHAKRRHGIKPPPLCQWLR